MSDNYFKEYEALKNAAVNEHQDAILEKLRPLNGLSFEERGAVFMRKVQVLELVLKGMLVRDYGYEDEKVENLSLGRLVGELRKNEEENDPLRGLLILLKRLVEYRNYVAHNILVDDALIRAITENGDARHFAERELFHAMYCVEQTISFHDHYLPMHKAENGQE